MRRQKQLVEALFAVANHNSREPLWRLSPGLVKDANGMPLLHFVERGERAYRYDIEFLLGMAAEGNLELMHGLLSGELGAAVVSPLPRARSRTTRPAQAPAMLIPIAHSESRLPFAIMVVALTTPTGDGDCLANRIAQCAACAHYFWLKSGVPAKYCGRQCRDRARRGKP